MSTAPRLLGQDVSIRIVRGGVVASTINSVASFNKTLDLTIKSDGFLGEPTDRKDYVMTGESGDFEFQVNRADWETQFKAAVKARARREDFTTFNVVRTDRYANGQSVVTTYPDVSWGPMTEGAASRAEFVKVKASFACSDSTSQIV